MHKIKRAALFLLAALFLIPSLGGCSSKEPYREVIGTCAGYDVLYEELRYVTLSYKDMFESTYGEGIWDTPESAEQYREELETVVWDMMLENYQVLAACAYYMAPESLEDDSLDEAVDAQIEELIAELGGKREFQAEMERLHMTEHFVRFTLHTAQLENELLYVLADDLGVIENDLDKFITWLKDDNFRYVQHVYIENDAGEDKEENRQLAENIREQLQNGVDIGEFVGSSINEDYENTAPYFLVRDVYVDEMESAAFRMKFDGDVSRVIDVGTGYYVMVRLEYTEESLLLQAEDLLTSYQWAKAEDIVETFKSQISMELNEYGKTIDLLAIE